MTNDEKREEIRRITREFNRELRALCKKIGVCDRCRNVDRPLVTTTKCEICEEKLKSGFKKLYNKRKEEQKNG